MKEQHNQSLWIVDFGSQYTQLITRKVRELGHSSEIITVKETLKRLGNEGNKKPMAIILSGGPQSVFEDHEDYSSVFDSSVPLLGICYGMQLMGKHFGGVVEKGTLGEYGQAQVRKNNSETIKNCPPKFKAWMSHSDHIKELPQGFKVILESENGLIAGIKKEEAPMMGLQFHPEVEHSEYGKEVLQYFLEELAGLKQNWSPSTMVQEGLDSFAHAKDSYVLCAFSGGVDSLVAATLAQKVLGEKLKCFFVDNGLLRPQDHQHIKNLQEKTSLHIEVVDAKETFYKNLFGESDPEKKRKIIGKTFIDVFEEKVKEYQRVHGIRFDYLLQGTLYPDVIESISPHEKGGKSVTIKSHHNVGGLPEKMNLKLLEPLRFLFKDEVRLLGKELDLPKEWLWRHPFPGPGIGVRVLGALDRDSIRKVQESDQILFEELKAYNEYDNVWQAFTVLLPIKTVGVKGDARAFEEVICLRLVDSTDGMTAKWSSVQEKFLRAASRRITNEVKGVTRVVYDITSKPPGTIEWE